MVEIKVVLPQPEGPTRRVSSPARATNSSSHRTLVRVGPRPSHLTRPRQWTAGDRALAGRRQLRSGRP